MQLPQNKEADTKELRRYLFQLHLKDKRLP